ncbi:MAG: hypothetical protein ACUZ8I_07210 [Candidatus Scalindua sp.]
MRRTKTKRRIPVQNRKRFKWWIKNNYIYLIIVGAVCLAMALILIFEVYQFERTRNMESLLNKSWKDIRWGQGGFSDQDIETLKRRYPNVNWEDTADRQRWHIKQERKRENRSRKRATEKFRREK